MYTLIHMENTPKTSSVNQAKHHKVILLGIVVLLVITFILYLYKNYKSPQKNTNTSTGITDTQNNNEDAPTLPEVFVINYETDKKGVYSIFKPGKNLNERDIKTHSFTFDTGTIDIVTNTWKDNTILIIQNLETFADIYELDVSLQGTAPAKILTVQLDSSTNERVTDAKFVDNGSSVAYIASEGKYDFAENSRLKIFSLNTNKETDSYFLSEKTQIYSGFKFLAKSPDSKTLYLNDIGGDGAAWWEQWYKLDRNIKNLEKLQNLPPIAEGEDTPARAFINPSGTKVAYIGSFGPVAPEDLNKLDTPEQMALYYSIGAENCLQFGETDLLTKYGSQGGTIMLLDLQTNNKTELFRNFEFADNYCMNIARKILSILWIDDSNLAFQTLTGVYNLNIDTNEINTLFEYRHTSSPWKEVKPAILSVQLPYIIFNDLSIVNVDSNKSLEALSKELLSGNRYFIPD